ncbi:MAG: hypothetical protein OEX82_00630, partial [Nitrosomonas sp.]|nr:hypothetical protein [Nitrosomonas sp.]
MKNYLLANKLTYLFFFIIVFSSLAVTAQETVRSAMPVININDGTRHAEDIILGYTEKLNHLSESDGGVSLLLYKDSYVIVHYPAYMKRA